MIKKLKIKNFKSHKNTELVLKNLTILTGINGVGKSSVFQSLLVLRQSYEKNVLKQGLDLNKPHCEIGHYSDALYEYADEDIISFSMSFDSESNSETTISWDFKPESNDLNKTFVPILGSSPENISSISLFNQNFQYLSAARLSPRESYPQDTNLVENKRQLSIEKGQGELTVHFLYYYGKEKKEIVKFENLINPLNEGNDLLSQTTAWEREISPNVNVVPSLEGKSFSLNYSFNKINDISTTNAFSAENVGFGLSYALPIIVAVLAAEKDSLLLIENPEAHLHPKGQSKLAELLSLAASNGVQIILETHSDHIINSVLIACKKFENSSEANNGINKELVQIYHFKKNDETESSEAIEIKVLEDGKINNQPEGFFDQSEKDLEFLLGF